MKYLSEEKNDAKSEKLSRSIRWKHGRFPKSKSCWRPTPAHLPRMDTEVLKLRALTILEGPASDAL